MSILVAVLLSILALAGYGLWCLSHVAFALLFVFAPSALCMVVGAAFIVREYRRSMRRMAVLRAQHGAQRERVAEALSHTMPQLPYEAPFRKAWAKASAEAIEKLRPQ